MTVSVALHVLSAVIWIGGMFFALLILRPASGRLSPNERLPLWGRVFQRFFPWVWMTAVILPLSGYWIIMDGYGGFGNLPVPVHIMQLIGWFMILIFVYLWTFPYRRLSRALAADDISDAARHLNIIRILVTINLVLGLINVVVGASGRYWQ